MNPIIRISGKVFEWKAVYAVRKTAFKALATLTFLILILSGCGQDNSISLPEFAIMLPDSTIINTRDIPKGGSIVMIYYSGDCGECHDEARDIISYIDDLRDVRFYFVSTEPMNEIRRFNDYFNLRRYENITVGLDTAGYLPRYLQVRSTPYLALFDSDRNLRGVIRGKPEIGTLIEKIHEL